MEESIDQSEESIVSVDQSEVSEPYLGMLKVPLLAAPAASFTCCRCFFLSFFSIFGAGAWTLNPG